MRFWPMTVNKLIPQQLGLHPTPSVLQTVGPLEEKKSPSAEVDFQRWRFPMPHTMVSIINGQRRLQTTGMRQDMKMRLQLIRMGTFTLFMPVAMATHSRTVCTMVLLGHPLQSKIAKEVIVGIRIWSLMTTTNSMLLILATLASSCTCIMTALHGLQHRSPRAQKLGQ